MYVFIQHTYSIVLLCVWKDLDMQSGTLKLSTVRNIHVYAIHVYAIHIVSVAMLGSSRPRQSWQLFGCILLWQFAFCSSCDGAVHQVWPQGHEDSQEVYQGEGQAQGSHSSELAGSHCQQAVCRHDPEDYRLHPQTKKRILPLVYSICSSQVCFWRRPVWTCR